MTASRTPGPEPSVWQRRLVTIPTLCRDRDWPFGKTATYAMAERGDIPTQRVGEHILVVMPELVRQLDMTTEGAA